MSSGHEHGACCEHGHAPEKHRLFSRPLILTVSATLILTAVSYVFAPLDAFRHVFFHYLHRLAGPMVLGIILGGVLDYAVPQIYISKILAAKKKRTILYSIGLGFLMSVCSHGILALSMELHKKGASGPAVISFLLASPWASLPITILLIGFFGLKALWIIFGALLIALTTGLIFLALDHYGWIERNRHTLAVADDFSVRRDILRRLKGYRFGVAQIIRDMRGIVRGITGLLNMVFWWVLLGMVIASFAGAYVPQDIFHRYFGPSPAGLLVTLLAATVIEVCSEGTAPLAFELYRQTGAFGNAFAFLMGGVVTDYTEIGLIWYNLGKRTALWMIAVTLPQVLLLGWILNKLF